MNPIYFKRSEAEILSKSFTALERLVDILNRFDHIDIKIEGHTDNQGAAQALEELSFQRAQAVKDYLIQQGIDPLRLTTAGFGGRFPVADNSTEERRSVNRRVEIKITKIE